VKGLPKPTVNEIGVWRKDVTSLEFTSYPTQGTPRGRQVWKISGGLEPADLSGQFVALWPERRPDAQGRHNVSSKGDMLIKQLGRFQVHITGLKFQLLRGSMVKIKAISQMEGSRKSHSINQSPAEN
jgi:hypothetical protein